MTTNERVTRNVRLLMASHNEHVAAFAARIGVGRSAVSDKLRGRRPWSMADLDAISGAYGVDPRLLLTESWHPDLASGPNKVTMTTMSFRHLGRRHWAIPGGGHRSLPVAA
jgi:transcriptional regulator with XRE-family HTH domain